MADIFCKARGIPYIDSIKDMLQVSADCFISNGHGIIGCLSISNDEAFEIISRGIDEIIFVFDVDNEKGLKDRTLSINYFEERIEKSKQQFMERMGYSIDFKFVIPVYSAETIMLYQYINNDCSAEVESYVSIYDTNKLHLVTLSILNKFNRSNQAKKIRDYLKLEILVRNAEANLKFREDSINTEVLNWIISGCGETVGLLNQSEGAHKLYEANRLLVESRKIDKEILIGAVKLSTDMSVEEMHRLLNTASENTGQQATVSFK